MLFIDPQGEYPRHYGDIMLDAPNWQLGDPLPAGWVEVAESPRPEPVDGTVTLEAPPVKVAGVMTQRWQTRPLTAEELERRDAPANAKARLESLGFTPAEIAALTRNLMG